LLPGPPPLHTLHEAGDGSVSARCKDESYWNVSMIMTDSSDRIIIDVDECKRLKHAHLEEKVIYKVFVAPSPTGSLVARKRVRVRRHSTCGAPIEWAYLLLLLLLSAFAGWIASL
jgi:hypothetical protein